MQPPTAEELKAFRIRLGRTRVEMARAIGVAESTYNNWESPRAKFPHKHLPTLIEMGWGQPKPLFASAATRAVAETGGVVLPLHMSVFAGDPSREEAFDPETSTIEVPPSFFVHDPQIKGQYEAMVVNGLSMRRRGIMPDDVLIVKLAPAVPDRALIVAMSRESKLYVKVNRYDNQRDRWVLESMDEMHGPIDELREWSVRGGVIGIWKRSVVNAPNMEYQMGRWLRG